MNSFHRWFLKIARLGILLAPLATNAHTAPPPAPEGMVYIPPGEFVMGRAGEANKTPHTVSLDGYFIDTHEVTQKDFQAVMGRNPSKFEGNDRPVEQVTWEEARAFCEKAGKRLPTEAEWEKAARAGSRTTYFWGDADPDAYTWHSGNSDGTTHPVGRKLPNPYGLYDMAGNVWEWVADWYERNYYEESPRHNPKGPENGDVKVLRGGSWYSGLKHQTTATRFWANPETRNSNFGFRCAKSIP